ncbi:MAG: hypothetical protein JKY65_12565 [Planctomycetes bacterium]|nr:hypothetical protein [Planctomycetota bacterium]
MNPLDQANARLFQAGVVACGLLFLLGTLAAGQTLTLPPTPLPARRAGPPTPASGYTIQDLGVFTLESAPGSEVIAARVERLFPQARADVEEILGRKLPAKPHVIVTPTDSEFVRRYARVAGSPPPSSVLAVALPGQDLVIIRGSGVVEGSNAGLESTLRHELGHLVLGALEARRAARLPRWLNEGLCEVAAGRKLADSEYTSLTSWAKFAQLPEFDDYAQGFPTHGQAGGRAYMISFAFMAWLGERKPTLDLLEALEAKSLNDAFQAVHGDLAGELELEWKAELVEDQSSFKSLIYSLNVWSVAALLAIVAGLRAYSQRRKLSKQLAEEEEKRAPRLARAWERAHERLTEGAPLVLCPECQLGTLSGDPPRCSSCAMTAP